MKDVGSSTSHEQAPRLAAKIVPVCSLTERDCEAMFDLMRKYYDGVSREKFLSDLSSKSDVILLSDRDETIRGFSTLRSVQVLSEGKTLRGIFSGDTVIDRDFWGGRALGKAFLRHMFFQKLRNPFDPLYWLLISKGYKTYLMMANNFSLYYPRYDRPTPASMKALMDAFYSSLFSDSYDRESGLIRMRGEADRLKSGVAEIAPALTKSSPKVAFFEEANPLWREGVELACIARMTFVRPLSYALKVFFIDRVLDPARRLFKKRGQVKDEIVSGQPSDGNAA